MTVIVTGALSLNLTLGAVADTRIAEAVTYPVTNDPAAYQCLIGVPHGFGYLIDREVYFRDAQGGLFGPWLVVDVEAEHHAPYMAQNSLAADVNCEDFVHRHGELLIEQGVH